MKKVTLIMVLVAGSLTATVTSCKKKGCTDPTANNYSDKAKKDDGSCTYNPVDETTVQVTSNITSDVTWETGKIYVLTSRIAVESGATLTIQPGTIIKGEAGSGANATCLIIAQGGKIMAQGTATQPIIFTSVADQIQPGQIVSPNLDPGYTGLWGGLILCGKAPISADAASVQIEGIPASDPNGLYGGSDPADNSGVIEYVSIRHGGTNIGEGNEINGLTCGGVGSGTTISHVEVVSNQDDGVEFFGGTVTVTNYLCWNGGDDGVDVDQAFNGTVDNFIVIAGDNTDHCMEIDGGEGATEAPATVKNGSIKGSDAAMLGDFRDGAQGYWSNIYFFNFPDPATAARGTLTLSDAVSQTNFSTDGLLNFATMQITELSGLALTDIFMNGTDAAASSVAAGANTVGADKTEFTGWTWADADGQLSDF